MRRARKGTRPMRKSARSSCAQNSWAPRAFLPSLRRCLVLLGTGAILAGLLTPVLGVGIAAASSVSSVSVSVSPRRPDRLLPTRSSSPPPRR